ncbi:MAG TPA: 23S rRNA (pseudouridine(1915)-N(3))-methyltransferase RlmH [Acidobacteriaceae bacterium]
MKLLLTSIATRPGSGPAQALLDHYLARLAPYTSAQHQLFRSEAAFLDSLARTRARTPPLVVLLDSRGTQLSSDALAARIAQEQQQDRQLLVFAIGPASGWSPHARDQAHTHAALLLSFGPMTLPHELARVLLAEQLYRAFTILAGHPYHSGH